MEQRLKRILDKSTFNNLMRFDNRLAFFHLAVRIFVEDGFSRWSSTFFLELHSHCYSDFGDWVLA